MVDVTKVIGFLTNNFGSDNIENIGSIISGYGAGKIGLRAFLYQRKVPGIDDPYCLAYRDEFGTAPLEDAYYVITECPVLYEARKALSEALCIPIGSWDHARFHIALRDPK